MAAHVEVDPTQLASGRGFDSRRLHHHSLCRPLTDSVIGAYSPCAMRFEWDPAKDKSARKRLSLSFEEAAECFETCVDHLET